MENGCSFEVVRNWHRYECFSVRHLLANVYTRDGSLMLENRPVFYSTEGHTAADEDTFYQYGDSLARGYFEDDRVIHDSKVLPLDSLRFIIRTVPENQI